MVICHHPALSGWSRRRNASVQSCSQYALKSSLTCFCKAGSTASTCASERQVEALVMAMTGRDIKAGSLVMVISVFQTRLTSLLLHPHNAFSTAYHTAPHHP